jgi:hypothetical protein
MDAYICKEREIENKWMLKGWVDGQTDRQVDRQVGVWNLTFSWQ